MRTTGHEPELQAACKAVRLAAGLCQRVQQVLKDDEKTNKLDASPVTIADYGAQALVAWSLQQSLPQQKFSMVAEEDATDLRKEDAADMVSSLSKLVNAVLTEQGADALREGQILDLIDTGSSEGGSQDRHWVLDPIDGTRGFVGMRQYAICLGLLDAGKVVAGVLGCPNLPKAAITDADGLAGSALRSGKADVGCLFAASRGNGAFVGSIAGDEMPSTRINVQEQYSKPEEARFMESFESRHSDFNFSGRVAQLLGVTKPPLRLDSQVKYGALARGDAAIFMRFPKKGYREKIWDHCAGAVIVEEAGAIISDAAGTPLDFGKGRFLDLQDGIIAAPASIHPALVKAVQEALAQQE
ncbi:hypothetical protein WJX74_004713 [Apatococcus lobatus]|uniref:3'(2'),5'-bisphosphate nucleotidase n=2 Tax=Apatococcus TaxID=904362 RepID=A0AAW1STQ7_9CHLO